MKKEKKLSHAGHKHYKLVSPAGADGRCFVMNDEGGRAWVSEKWLDIDGDDCWPCSRKSAIHIESSVWL